MCVSAANVSFLCNVVVKRFDRGKVSGEVARARGVCCVHNRVEIVAMLVFPYTHEGV